MINNTEYFNQNLPAGFDGQFDWDFLIPAFGNNGIKPSDIDCLIERNGRFLLFETKKTGSIIPIGQTITLRSLHALGCFTIFYIQMDTEENEKNNNAITKFSVMLPTDKNPIPIDLRMGNPMDIIFKYASLWYKDADRCGNKTKKLIQ